MRLAALIGAAVIAASPALAQAEDDMRPTIMGAGATSCGGFAKVQEPLVRDIMVTWIQGHLSRGAAEAANRLRVNLLGQSDFDGLTAWLDGYCSRNPLHTLQQAAWALELELLKSAPPLK